MNLSCLFGHNYSEENTVLYIESYTNSYHTVSKMKLKECKACNKQIHGEKYKIENNASNTESAHHVINYSEFPVIYQKDFRESHKIEIEENVRRIKERSATQRHRDNIRGRFTTQIEID